MERMLEAVNTSVEAALHDGTLDERKNAAVIAALRTLASQIDNSEIISIDGKMDNVTLPTLIKLMQIAGITPNVEKSKVANPKSGDGNIEKLQQRAKRVRRTS